MRSRLSSTHCASTASPPWIDQSGLVELGEVDPSGEDWAKAGVTVLVWIVVPLVFGLLRLKNEDDA